MTATAARSVTPAGSNGRRGSLTATWPLVRFMLRRDRIKLSAWAAGFAAFVLYLTTALPAAYRSQEDLQQVVGLFGDPVGRLVTGPGYGFDAPSYERLIANGYGLNFLLLSALMSIFLVVRHTRAEEQTGRAELVRANVVGAHAPLTAALLVALVANVIVSLVVTAGMLAAGFPSTGSVLFGASVGAAGLSFAGLTALTVQLTQFSRAAAGLAGAGLGAAFALRGGGDMARMGGNVLSWLSALGWPMQTAPFVFDRWWPLALSLCFAAVTAGLGFALSVRRDLGASLLATRSGRPTAPGWLRSPFTLSLRLQRTSIIAWSSALFASGALYGAFTKGLTTAFEDLPSTFTEVLGTSDDIVAGYLGYMAVFMAYLVAAFAILAVHGLRGEESSGRADPVLATPVSRWAWLGSNLAVTAIGAVIALAAAGVGTGAFAAIVTGEVSHLWVVTAAHLNHVPTVLVFRGWRRSCTD